MSGGFASQAELAATIASLSQPTTTTKSRRRPVSESLSSRTPTSTAAPAAAASSSSSKPPKSPRLDSEPLPPGWRSEWSEKHRQVYYHHQKSGRSQWEKPVVNPNHEPQSPPPPVAPSPSAALTSLVRGSSGSSKAARRDRSDSASSTASSNASSSRPRSRGHHHRRHQQRDESSADERSSASLEPGAGDSFRMGMDSTDEASFDLDDALLLDALPPPRTASSSSLASLDFQRQHATEDTVALRALSAADDAFAREQLAAPPVAAAPAAPAPAPAPAVVAAKPKAAVAATAAPARPAPVPTRVSFREEDQTWEVTKMNRKVSTLDAERDRVMARLMLAHEGYNDVGESIEQLQTNLDRLNDELASLHERIAQLTMMPIDGGDDGGADDGNGGSAVGSASGGGGGGGGGGLEGGKKSRLHRLNVFGRTHSQGLLLRSSAGARPAAHSSSSVRASVEAAAAAAAASSSSESTDFDEPEVRPVRQRRLDTEALKRDLGPLDPRLEIYSSSPRVRNRSNSSAAAADDERQLWWRFDHDEAERARKRAEQFERVLSFVKPRRNLVLRLSAISKLKKLGDEPGATLYSGMWEQVRVVVRRLKSPVLAESSFLAEVRSLQRVQHAGVQMCLGVSLNPLCVVVEYVGRSLYDVLHAQHVAIDMPVVVSIGRQLAEALKVCHSAGIVHRDLNSFNVLCDDNRQVKIGGFRFASPSGESSGGDAFVVPAEHRRWQAPELTRGHATSVVDEKADVWSFGVVMCEIVSQEVPFADMTPDAAAFKVAFEGLRPTPPEHCPTLLRELIRLTCEHDVESRVSITGALALFEHIEGRLFFGDGSPKSPKKAGDAAAAAAAGAGATGATATATGAAATSMELVGANGRQFWSLRSEQEAEARQKRQTRYNEIIRFLEDRNLMIDFKELRLGGRLGEGSFSVVFKASWKGFPVAVKRLKNTSISHRFFLREVSMLWRARHRSVVLFMGATASPPCIVTVFMPGGSLYEAIHERRVRIDFQLALSMAVDLGEAMRHLHALNVLHRDFTSRNVLLDDSHNAFVADFGLSREASANGDGMTFAGICNPRWRAPELTRGHAKYTPRVDVYSFALVMFELFAMQLPFADVLDGVTAAAKAAYEQLRPTLPPHLPAVLRELIAQCWAEQPNDRPDFNTICRQLGVVVAESKKAM